MVNINIQIFFITKFGWIPILLNYSSLIFSKLKLKKWKEKNM